MIELYSLIFSEDEKSLILGVFQVGADTSRFESIFNFLRESKILDLGLFFKLEQILFDLIVFLTFFGGGSLIFDVSSSWRRYFSI